MPIMEWNNSYQVKIAEIDDHHRRLIGLLNRSYDAYKEGASTDSLATVIKELSDYTVYHFNAEEYWMAKHSYPMLELHKVQHAIFTKKIDALQNDFIRGKKTLSTDIFRLLASWLRNHILETDSLYGRFIAERGLTIW